MRGGEKEEGGRREEGRKSWRDRRCLEGQEVVRR
jgi:hypothetical protein